MAFGANPNTGAYMHAADTWYSVGGTSVGSPNWAAVLGDNAAARALSLERSALSGGYTSSNCASDMHEITSGSNGHCGVGPGWDAVISIGSPNVTNLIARP